MEKQTIVLYPSPGMGHLVSMVELGKFIIKHQPSFSITILITTPPYNTASTAPYINRVSKTNPSITFHYLPVLPISNSTNRETIALEFLLLNNPLVNEALLTISASSTIPAFIIDFFCFSSLEIAEKLGIPVFCFFTSGVAVLSVFLHLPTVDRNTTESFKDMNTLLDFPGVPQFLSSDMFKVVLDRTSKSYECFLYFCSLFPKFRGIIVNSFESLELRALKAVRDGLSVPDAPTPPIYCMGPLIASDDHGSDGDGGQVSCLDWLDMQPSTSVVFLCFGSSGWFSEAQLKEMAIGLEKSGQRFLWVVRSPPSGGDENWRMSATQDPDLNALLPDGFLDRTKERGMVVKSWAPQIEVLGKKSVGGFVTHCGWNSVLEALCAGVPMVAWPLYAEQRINRVFLVEEMKVALSMEEGKDGFVKAEQVEKKVRALMESEEGGVIREHVAKLCDKAKEAISVGGSSVKALDDLAELLKR